MGTSVNQMSPRTKRWNIVQSVYTTDAISADRAITEIWRAATSEPSNLATQLSQPIVERIGQLSITGGSPGEVAMSIDMEIASSGQSSFACDVARIAAIKAAQLPLDQRQVAYREGLFVEASNYFVSRDISGCVGDKFRSKSVSDIIEFKRKAMDATADSVRKSSETLSATKSWDEFVSTTVDILRGSRKK